MSEIAAVVAGPDLVSVRDLLEEYGDWIGVDLSFQDFAREMAELPGDYVAPSGTLLLARVSREAAGCVAIHRWAEETCEMKRLFVRDRFRGLGLGGRLARRAIDWARTHGYRNMLLDTLPSMSEARGLYARLGFKEIPPYRVNPVEGAAFLSLDLSAERRAPPSGS